MDRNEYIDEAKTVEIVINAIALTEDSDLTVSKDGINIPSSSVGTTITFNVTTGQNSDVYTIVGATESGETPASTTTTTVITTTTISSATTTTNDSSTICNVMASAYMDGFKEFVGLVGILIMLFIVYKFVNFKSENDFKLNTWDIMSIGKAGIIFLIFVLILLGMTRIC